MVISAVYLTPLLKKVTEWLAGQRNLGEWHVGARELFSGTQV
jgi:hypothetical protein